MASCQSQNTANAGFPLRISNPVFAFDRRPHSAHPYPVSCRRQPIPNLRSGSVWTIRTALDGVTVSGAP
ncbi:MAG TPA: hypothetical protein PKX94_04745, partial [Opitutales bacterium]|nr:hypothetical protein [Opitutales bacterium]